MSCKTKTKKTVSRVEMEMDGDQYLLLPRTDLTTVDHEFEIHTIDYVEKIDKSAPEALKKLLAERKIGIFDALRAVKAMDDTRADCFDADGNPIEEYRECYGGKTFEELWDEVISKFESGDAYCLYLAVADVCGFDPSPPKKALDADAYWKERYDRLAEEALALDVQFERLPEDASTGEYMSEVEPVVQGPELRKKIKAAYRKERAETRKAEREDLAAQD